MSKTAEMLAIEMRAQANALEAAHGFDESDARSVAQMLREHASSLDELHERHEQLSHLRTAQLGLES